MGPYSRVFTSLDSLFNYKSRSFKLGFEFGSSLKSLTSLSDDIDLIGESSGDTVLSFTTSSPQPEIIETTRSEERTRRHTTNPSPTRWPNQGSTEAMPVERTTDSETQTVTEIIPSIEIFTINSTATASDITTSSPEIEKVTNLSPIQDLSQNTTVQNEETTRQVETTNTFEISTQEIPVTVTDNDQGSGSGDGSRSGDLFYKNESMSAIAGNLTLDYGPTENPILIMEEDITTPVMPVDTTVVAELTTTNDVADDVTTAPQNDRTSPKVHFESSAEGSGFNFEGSTSISVDDEDLYKSNTLTTRSPPEVLPEVTTGSADVPICLHSNDCPKPKTCNNGQCVCEYGFTLESDCIEYSICPGLNDLPCSGKGTCIPPDTCGKWTSNNASQQSVDCIGTCECFADYSGPDCGQWQSPEPPVPEKDMIGCTLDCGEFGSCEMYNETMFKCMCDEGHFGEHCELSNEENEGESSYISGTPEPTNNPTSKMEFQTTSEPFVNSTIPSSSNQPTTNPMPAEMTYRNTTNSTNNQTTKAATDFYPQSTPSVTESPPTESPTILYIVQETSTPPVVNSSSYPPTTAPETLHQTTTLPWTKNKVENGSITQTIGIYLKDDSYHHVIDINPEQEILIELRKIISDLYQMDDFLPKTFDVESIEFIESSLEPVIPSSPGTRSKRQNQIPKVWKISMKVKYLEESDFARGLLSTDEIKIEYSRIYKMLERFARDGDYRILFGTPPNTPPDTDDNDTIETMLSTAPSVFEANTTDSLLISTTNSPTTESSSDGENDTLVILNSTNRLLLLLVIGEIIEESTTKAPAEKLANPDENGSGSGFGENDSEDAVRTSNRPDSPDGSGFYGEERLTDDPDLLGDHDASPTIHPDVSFRYFRKNFQIKNFLGQKFYPMVQRSYIQWNHGLVKMNLDQLITQMIQNRA